MSTVERMFCGEILDDASSNNLPSLQFLVSNNIWTGLVHLGILINGIVCPLLLFFLVEHCLLRLNVQLSCLFAWSFLSADVPFMSVSFFVALLRRHWWTLLWFMLWPPTSLLLWLFGKNSIPPHYSLAWRHHLIRKMYSCSAFCPWNVSGTRRCCDTQIPYHLHGKWSPLLLVERHNPRTLLHFPPCFVLFL